MGWRFVRQGAVLAVIVAGALPATAPAQIDLTVNDVGLAIGDKPRMTGIRLNYRDRRLERVNGINITIWSPYGEATGTVNGLALGLPVTGARRINGIATGVFGVGASESITGLTVAPLGAGTGGELRGVIIGGLGAGAGSRIEGIGVGGLGIGSGGPMTGVFAGGLGVGSGEAIRGVAIGGLGVGAGGGLTGIAIGGIGVGSGGTLKGISIGGIGVGSGGDVVGLTVGGIGVGSGGSLRGVSIAGIGVGASTLRDLVISGIGAGGEDVRGVVLTGAYFRVARGGTQRGLATAAFTRVSGRQYGLTLGILNYARELRGLQIGLINISDNGGRRLVLPIIGVRGHRKE
jgi:hypothetical protein